MKTADRIVLSALAMGLWAIAGVYVAGPGRADAQFTQSSIWRLIENCRVEGHVAGAISGRADGTVAGEIQVQHGSYGVLQNGRIVYAEVKGALENGRLIDGKIVCPGK
ncbi:MAG: hypothetical protein RIB59_06770 [Rhodospirillales bacterium]